jgi:hypothetical protein
VNTATSRGRWTYEQRSASGYSSEQYAKERARLQHRVVAGRPGTRIHELVGSGSIAGPRSAFSKAARSVPRARPRGGYAAGATRGHVDRRPARWKLAMRLTHRALRLCATTRRSRTSRCRARFDLVEDGLVLVRRSHEVGVQRLRLSDAPTVSPRRRARATTCSAVDPAPTEDRARPSTRRASPVHREQRREVATGWIREPRGRRHGTRSAPCSTCRPRLAPVPAPTTTR